MDFKKASLLAVSLLAFTTYAQAGTYSPPVCTSYPVSVPCEDTGWDVAFTAFYSEVTSNDQFFLIDTTDDIDKYLTVDPDYEFDFEVQGSFHFGAGSDITVTWRHISDDAHAKFDATNRQILGYINPLTGIPPTEVEAWFDHDIDIINGEFGQMMNVGNDVDMRVHAGVQYADIEFQKRLKEGPVELRQQDARSDFEGFGARGGVDLFYHAGSGFNAVARLAGSLLVGDLETKFRVIRPAPAPITGFDGTTEHTIVPSGSAKLGFAYSSDIYNGTFSVEGGWSIEGFYHAARFALGTGNFENVTMHGPYVRLHYRG